MIPPAQSFSLRAKVDEKANAVAPAQYSQNDYKFTKKNKYYVWQNFGK
jgi:hypothetical protein